MGTLYLLSKTRKIHYGLNNHKQQMLLPVQPLMFASIDIVRERVVIYKMSKICRDCFTILIARL